MYQTNNKNNKLTFLDSAKVKVFPCGRRRTRLIDEANDNKTAGYIPFDPEARLNTEANNRKHSALNGFKQNYIKSYESNMLSLVIGGYLFDITIDEELGNTLGNFATKIGGTEANVIYANIKLEDIVLFSSTLDGTVPITKTTILRDQTATSVPETCLDIAYNNDVNELRYYFSGLSFSTEENAISKTSDNQHIITLKVLEKVGSTWQPYLPSMLPEIDHGDVEKSIKVGTIQALGDLEVNGAVSAGAITMDGKSVVTLNVVEIEDNKFQLQFNC